MQALVAAHPSEAQALYGASIISFLGAIHWGLAMADYAGWSSTLSKLMSSS